LRDRSRSSLGVQRTRRRGRALAAATADATDARRVR
jgi:hypothetical protein